MKFRKNAFGGLLNNGVFSLLLMLWAIVQLYPIIWLFYSSLKPTVDIKNNIFALPKSLYIGNYDFSALKGLGVTIVIYLKNSLIVTIVSLLILIIISLFAGYAIAKIRFPGKNILIVVLMAMLGVPIHALIIPLYYFIADIGLLNNYFGLILPYVAFNFPFATLLLQAYFRQFPNEILEAARVDGCSNIRLFLKVVIPISLGSISAVLIITFLAIWNEFLFALVIMKDNAAKTLPVGLMGLKGQYSVDWGPLLAGLSVAIIPSILFYLIFHKNIIKGVTAGSVKG